MQRSEASGRTARAAPAVGRQAAGRRAGDPGDVRADLEQVFRREYADVVRVARRVLGSAREAEDVAQEVFIAFSRAAVPAGQARGWLLTAAAHTALNSLRSDSRRARRESVAAVQERLPDAADEAVTRTERARVRAALGRLPQNQGLVLVLRHSGMSYQEIAVAVGMPASGVGTTLRRAEAAVRKELESDESPA
jgi:RNA polymerase sigma factor (sigma-70 family)